MDRVGFAATLEGLGTYLNGVRQINTANAELVRQEEAAALAAKKADQALAAAQGNLNKVALDADKAAAAQQKLNLATEESALAHQKAATAASNSAGAHDNLANKLKTAAQAAAFLIGTYVGVQSIDNAVKKTQELGEETYKLQLQTGMAAEKASGLIYAADKLGLGFDSLSRGLGIFSRNMTMVQEANDGFTGAAKTTTEVLASMGIKVLDANKQLLPAEELLARVADKFKIMKDADEKAGLATQLFGRAGRDMLPILNQGRQGIEQLNAEAQHYGLTLSQGNVNAIHNFTLAQRDMNASLKGIEVQIGSRVLPVLTAFFKLVADHQKEVIYGIAAIAAAFLGVATAAGIAFVAENLALFGIPALVVAAGAAIIVLATHWTKVKEAALDAWNQIPGPIRTVINWLATDVVAKISGFVGVVLQGFRVMKDGIAIVLDIVRGDWSKAWDDLKTLGVDAAKGLADAILSVFGSMANLVIGVFETMVNQVIAALNKAIDAAKSIPVLGSLVPGGNIGDVSLPRIETPNLGGALGGAGNLFGNLVDKIKKGIEDLKKPVDDTTSGLGGLGEGLSQLPSAATAAASGLGQAARNIVAAAQQAARDTRNVLGEAEQHAQATGQQGGTGGGGGNGSYINDPTRGGTLVGGTSVGGSFSVPRPGIVTTTGAAAPAPGQQKADDTPQYLAANDALQRKINVAIGQGNRDLALSLVGQQKGLIAAMRAGLPFASYQAPAARPAAWPWSMTKGNGGLTPSFIFDDGGFTRQPTLAVLSQDARPELVLPLGNPTRSRELLATIPPPVMAQLLPHNRQSASSLFGDLNVQGFTLGDMEAAAHRAVSSAFTRARATAGRGGGQLLQGVGGVR